MISDNMLNKIAELIADEASYIGLGTGIAPLESDTLLASEILRKAVTTVVDTNTVILDVFFDETEANGTNFTNTGAFDSTATSSINTGKLLAGFGIDITKTDVETFTLSYEITVERGA